MPIRHSSEDSQQFPVFHTIVERTAQRAIHPDASHYLNPGRGSANHIDQAWGWLAMQDLPIEYCGGSSPAGVLWWALAILTVDGSGEGHQQEKTKETERS